MIALAGLLLGGCASTRVDLSGERSSALCSSAESPHSALIVWQAIWRADQKDVAEREAAAGRAIEAYFAQPGCFAGSKVRHLRPGPLSDDELRHLARAEMPHADRVLWIGIHELGPVIRLLASPALIDGGTEVRLELRALDAAGTRLAHLKTHWEHGGPGIIRGVATLPDDLTQALDATLKFRPTNP